MIEIILESIILFSFSLLFLGIFLMILAAFHKLRFRSYKLDENYRPKFSVISPAYNEGKVMNRTIKKFLETSYPNDKKEFIIVNDGSDDSTKAIISKYASKIIYPEIPMVFKKHGIKNNIILLDRVTGGIGKSYALNDGKKYATGDILLFIDADVQLGKHVFEKAARHFNDKKVGAVAGYISLEGSKGILNKFIDFEFIIGQKLMRRGFNVLGVHYVIPGGCAVFSREVLEKIGDYHHDTLAEDTDITWRVVTEARADVHFDPEVYAKVDEPTKLKALWDQRVRWARGNLEVTWKHRNKVGKPRYGRAVTIFYPFWISSMILPIAFILSSTTLLLAIALQINFVLIPVLTNILITAFIGFWLIGTILNKGKSTLAGLMTPGIVILVSIISIAIWENGIVDLVSYLGFPQFSFIAGLTVGMWILISIPATYMCMRIEKNHPRIASILQLGIIGYWMFLITTMFHSYVCEFRGDEQKWIRTVR